MEKEEEDDFDIDLDLDSPPKSPIESIIDSDSDDDEKEKNKLAFIDEEEEVLPTFGRSKSLFHSLRKKRVLDSYISEEDLYKKGTFLAVRSDEVTTEKYLLCKLLVDVKTITKKYSIMWLQSAPVPNFYMEGYNDEISATTVLDSVTLHSEGALYTLPADQKKKLLKKIKKEEYEENTEINIQQIKIETKDQLAKERGEEIKSLKVKKI